MENCSSWSGCGSSSKDRTRYLRVNDCSVVSGHAQTSYKCVAADEVHRSECAMPTITPHRGICHTSVRTSTTWACDTQNCTNMNKSFIFLPFHLKLLNVINTNKLHTSLSCHVTDGSFYGVERWYFILNLYKICEKWLHWPLFGGEDENCAPTDQWILQSSQNLTKFSTSKFLLRAHKVLVPEQHCSTFELLTSKNSVDTQQLVKLVQNKHSLPFVRGHYKY